ncbi:MAG: polyprenyl synthetase family protein [bacterium]|nr:polyprenyl synthetase family protein [bacterium]
MNLKKIQKPVEELLAETNKNLIEKVKSNISLLNEMSDLTPIARGKKIRSTVLFLLSGMTGSLDLAPQLVEVAASVEMFHLSSLIHDDILDNSEQRRGQKTLNINMGNFRSVLWGDYLFISSFTAIHKLGKPVLLDISLEAARLMVEGQIIEAENAYNFDLELDTYYDVIMRKTSSLFAAVTKIAAALSEKTPASLEQFYRFGLDIGTIFQVSDDMLDIFSTQSGKDRFRDLEEGKITLPFILLMKKSDTDIKEDFMKGNREKLLELFEKHKIKALCMTEVDGYYQRCLKFLESFPDSIYKKSLLEVLEFIKYRDY